MLEIHGLTPSAPELYEAIRAQLSAAPLTLDRIHIDEGHAFVTAPRDNASKLAAENNAAMLFWIEDEDACRLYFYIPDSSGGRINSRTLDLDLDSPWSRYQIIAIAAASMVEGLLIRHNIKPAAQKKEPPVVTPPPPPSAEKHPRKHGWVDMSAAYTGSLFAAGVVTSGIGIGVGVRPTRHFIITASFIQNFPLELATREYRLTITSRDIEVSAAGRMWVGTVGFLLGVAWSMDLRSFSTTFGPPTIRPISEGPTGIHALIPHVSVEWRVHQKIGLFALMGASIALNETVYKVDRIESETEELRPFFVKLRYQVGLVIHL